MCRPSALSSSGLPCLILPVLSCSDSMSCNTASSVPAQDPAAGNRCQTEPGLQQACNNSASVINESVTWLPSREMQNLIELLWQTLAFLHVPSTSCTNMLLVQNMHKLHSNPIVTRRYHCAPHCTAFDRAGHGSVSASLCNSTPIQQTCQAEVASGCWHRLMPYLFVFAFAGLLAPDSGGGAAAAGGGGAARSCGACIGAHAAHCAACL